MLSTGCGSVTSVFTCQLALNTANYAVNDCSWGHMLNTDWWLWLQSYSWSFTDQKVDILLPMIPSGPNAEVPFGSKLTTTSPLMAAPTCCSVHEWETVASCLLLCLSIAVLCFESSVRLEMCSSFTTFYMFLIHLFMLCRGQMN